MDITLIKAPIDYAGGAYGSALGPDCICSSNFIFGLNKIGCNVKVEECLIAPITPDNLEDPKAKYISSVVKTNLYLATMVERELTNQKTTVVIGGDHSIFLGSIAGVVSFANNCNIEVGVIYVDAHADFNTVATTLTGNIHGQPLAASCGLGHADLINLYFSGRKLSSKNTIIIGARDIDPEEKELLKASDLKVYTSLDIEKYGIYNVIKQSINELAPRCKWIHLSFDIDAIDPIYAPGTGIRIPGGLTYREALCLLKTLREYKVIQSADFVEYNPLKDESGVTCKLCQEMILTLFGKEIM